MSARFVILFPIALTISLFSLPLESLEASLIRGLILVSVVPGVLYLGRGLSRTEALWVVISLLYLVATFLSAFYAEHREPALNDFIRHAYSVVMSWLLVLYLRIPASRAAFIYGMAFLTVVGLLEILYLYVSYVGFSYIGIAELASFKSSVAKSVGIALNPVSFFVLLAFLLGYPAFRTRRWITAFSIVILLAALFFSGSRTTLYTFLGSAFVVGLIFGVRQQPLWLRRTTYCLVVPGVVAGITYLLLTSDILFASAGTSDFTTGRTALWTAGLEMFIVRPLTGWGAESWSHYVSHYIVISDLEFVGTLTELKAGAFHNVYVTVLAEKGLIVFVPAALMAAFLISQCWRLWGQRMLLTGLDAKHAEIALLLVVCILVRGFSEHGGWWGYNNGAVDWISYAAASLIVATASLLDRMPYKTSSRKRKVENERYSLYPSK